MKNFLTKYLSKSLPKVLLLVALFFGGCSTTETNTTPSDALIDLIGGEYGVTKSEYDSETDMLTLYGFEISDDAVYHREYSGEVLERCLEYTTGTDTSATYEGIWYTDDDRVIPTKVRLTGLTSKGGTWSMYFWGDKYYEEEFKWYTDRESFIPVVSSVSSVSFESYSSVVRPK